MPTRKLERPASGAEERGGDRSGGRGTGGASPATAADVRSERPDEPVALGQIARLLAAIASLGAAAVHASAIAEHSFDAVHAGAFIAMAAFQAGWAYAVLRSTSRGVLLAGAIGHGAIALVWLVSQTGGIPPWLPGPPGREPAGFKDLVAVVLAVAVLAGIDLLTRRDAAARPVRPRDAGAAVGAFVVTVAVAAAAASFAAGHVHGAGAGAAHGDAHSHSPAHPAHDP
jgi:hypothetical protein